MFNYRSVAMNIYKKYDGKYKYDTILCEVIELSQIAKNKWNGKGDKNRYVNTYVNQKINRALLKNTGSMNLHDNIHNLKNGKPVIVYSLENIRFEDESTSLLDDINPDSINKFKDKEYADYSVFDGLTRQQMRKKVYEITGITHWRPRRKK